MSHIAPIQGTMREPLRQISHDCSFDRNSSLCLDGRIIRLGDYAIEGGGYADVWQGSFGTRMVAIKVTRPFGSTGMQIKQSKLLRRLWREYLVWSSLSHANILQCLGFSYDFSQRSFVPSLISPWMSNGTIIAYLEKHPDTDRLELLLGIADGLSYLHSRNPAIVHGDIRAGNVLVSDSGVPYIGDFGLSRILSEVRGMTTSSEPGGSVRWMAPELLSDDTGVSVRSDVWAYAMTILEIFSGERPYSTLRREAVVLNEVRHGRIPLRPEGPRILPNAVWIICQHCWQFEARQRLLMSEVKSHLYNYRNHKTVEGIQFLPIPSVDTMVYTSRKKLVSPKAMHNDPGFVCPVPGCGSTFTGNLILKGHLRWHYKEQSFRCKWPGCGKDFARHQDCKQHEVLHLDIWPYTCTVCKKMFARMDALNRHLCCEEDTDFAQYRQPLHDPHQQHHGNGKRSNPNNAAPVAAYMGLII